MRPAYQTCDASISLSLSLFLSLPLVTCICWPYYFFCGLIVVTGSRLLGAEAKQQFLKRFLKGLLESVSPGLYLPFTTKRHRHLSLLSFFNPNMQHSLSSLPQFLSLPLFHSGLILFLLPLACSFSLACSQVLGAVFHLLTPLSFIPVLTSLCLSLWCFSPFFVGTSSFVFYSFFYALVFFLFSSNLISHIAFSHMISSLLFFSLRVIVSHFILASKSIAPNRQCC